MWAAVTVSDLYRSISLFLSFYANACFINVCICILYEIWTDTMALHFDGTLLDMVNAKAK